MLAAFDIQQVVDVRTIPRSRHNPQFNEQDLSESLRQHGIKYTRLEGLGGLRHTSKDSINSAWKNASFRGYADYMQTPEFSSSLEKLMILASESRCAIMCAEAVPWRCHRSLIADALLIRDVQVMDIYNEKSSKPHRLTPWAKVDGTTITYPGAPSLLDEQGTHMDQAQ